MLNGFMHVGAVREGGTGGKEPQGLYSPPILPLATVPWGQQGNKINEIFIDFILIYAGAPLRLIFLLMILQI